VSTQTESMSAEQAADLAALTVAANEDQDAPGAPNEAQEQSANVPDLADELAALFSVAVATLGPIFPSIKAIYTKDTIGAASGAIAAVCTKRGWLSGGMMGEYAEEITALAIVGPLALATYQGVKSDIEAREKKEPVEVKGLDLSAKAPTETPGAKTVSFGAAAPAET